MTEWWWLCWKVVFWSWEFALSNSCYFALLYLCDAMCDFTWYLVSIYVISLASRVLSIFKESLSTCQIIAFFTGYSWIAPRKQYIDMSKTSVISKFIIAKILGCWFYSSSDVMLLNSYVGELARWLITEPNASWDKSLYLLCIAQVQSEGV